VWKIELVNEPWNSWRYSLANWRKSLIIRQVVAWPALLWGPNKGRFVVCRGVVLAGRRGVSQVREIRWGARWRPVLASWPVDREGCFGSVGWRWRSFVHGGWEAMGFLVKGGEGKRSNDWRLGERKMCGGYLVAEREACGWGEKIGVDLVREERPWAGNMKGRGLAGFGRWESGWEAEIGEAVAASWDEDGWEGSD